MYRPGGPKAIHTRIVEGAVGGRDSFEWRAAGKLTSPRDDLSGTRELILGGRQRTGGRELERRLWGQNPPLNEDA